MKALIILFGLIGLALTILPSLLLFYGNLESDMHKNLTAVGMVCWFIAAVVWDKIGNTTA